VVIVRVGLQMLDQLVDTLGQQGNLNIWRASIGAVDLVISDDTSLIIFI
jgi:hypothetical protein